MQRLKENLKAYDTVCELSKSPCFHRALSSISPSFVKFYGMK
jgi:hypothetical protein